MSGLCIYSNLTISVPAVVTELITLSHWGRNKMDISQITFSNAFSWMKMYEFGLRLHWSLFLRAKGPINNIPSLVQIMAWCRSCDKPLSEPMVVSLLKHICVTGPQWVTRARPSVSTLLATKLVMISSIFSDSQDFRLLGGDQIPSFKIRKSPEMLQQALWVANKT